MGEVPVPQLRIVSPQEVTEALLAGAGDQVLGAAQAYLQQGGLTFLADGLVQPVLEEVGQRWLERLANVAESNAAAGLLHEVLSSLLPRLPWQSGGPVALVACVQGERHELGAHLASHLLALGGWQVHFLGADTPAADLAQMAARLEPALVGLSVTLPEHLPSTWYTISSLRHAVEGVRIIVGGRAARSLLDAQLPVRPDAVACTAAEVSRLIHSAFSVPGAPPPPSGP